MVKAVRALGVLIAGVVVAVGVLVHPVAVAVAAPLGVLAGLACVAHRAQPPVAPMRQRGEWVRVGLIAAAAVATGSLLVGLIVLVGGSPAVALLGVVVVAVPGWCAVRVLGRGRRPVDDTRCERGAPGPALRVAPAPQQPPVPVASLSVAELCRAWRVSYLWLATRDPTRLELVAPARRCHLDELERRPPSRNHHTAHAARPAERRRRERRTRRTRPGEVDRFSDVTATTRPRASTARARTSRWTSHSGKGKSR